MRSAAAMGGLVLVVSALATGTAMAHGDVTPHPVDTTGLPALGTTWVEPDPYRGNAKAVAIGAEGYLHNCAGCHGLDAVSGGMAPDLRQVARDCLDMAAKAQASCLKDSDDYFKGIVLDGRKTMEGRYTMPSYKGVLTQEAVWAIKAYLDERTVAAARSK